MRRMPESRTATATAMVGVAMLALALYSRAGEARAPQTPSSPVAAQGTSPRQIPATPAPRPARPPAAPRVDFAKQIRPILEANCLECHSADKRKGGLSLAAYTDVLDGGRSGAVVRPGQAERSLILARVTGALGDQMPLDTVPLGDVEIATLRRWVDEGARLTPASPPAPAPWEAPLSLTAPPMPAVVWASWTRPADRLVAAYLSKARVPQPRLIADASFARRAYLDIWGLLPSQDELQAFVANQAPDKRDRLVAALLADTTKYAEHWISFWNDLLRNDDGQSYFSDAEGGGRQSITPYLLPALTNNAPYDEMLRKLINPTQAGDPAGFIIGVNWRGETSAAVTPWMQASQNTAQAFLGVNFKCNACHDSFVSKWKLKDAYGLAAYFSPEARLQLYRCDIAKDEYTGPSFFFPELARSTPSDSLADRRATAVAIFTDPRNGRMPRTIVNRVWTRLLGHGIVPNSDEMDGQPWSPELLDWLAADLVAHQYDLKHLIGTVVMSRAYQMAAVPRPTDVSARGYRFRGPEIRRLTAEQFADAVGSITGEWSIVAPSRAGGAGNPGAGPAGRGGAPLGVVGNAPPAGGRITQPPPPVAPVAGRGAPAPTPPAAPRTSSDAVTTGVYGREYRAPSTNLTRALGRPIRDQVTSVRAHEATTLQALELVNGEILTARLMRGARRLIGELPPDPKSLFNAAVAGRSIQPRLMEADVSSSSTLYLLVSDTGSNAPERVLPVWANLQLVSADGTVVPVSSLVPSDRSGLRGAPDAVRLPVKNNSRLVFDIAGKGFTRLRGTLNIENDRADVGSTLNPSLRFLVFDVEPNMSRLLPPAPDLPAPFVPVATVRATVDRIFWSALGRAPSVAERRLAEAAIADPARPGKASAASVADLLWAVLMKPEFQLIY